MIRKLSRRSFLSGVCFAALTISANAQFSPNGLGSAGFGGASISDTIPIGIGWNTLPLGAGGLVTGMFIANDGSMVCRTDVGNIYRWSGKTSDYADASQKWVPLLNYTSLAGKGPAGGAPVPRASNPLGGWEHVLAPNNSSVHVAVFADMTNVSGKGWIWYSTDAGATWNQSNVAFTGSSVDTNASPYKNCYYKIIIDPANENVAYCGMPISSGNGAGVFTSFNKSGGSTLATWASLKTSGVTPIGDVTNGISCGLTFDTSQGTVSVGGQTVTKRIIIPVGGIGIIESTDGGVTWNEIASAAMGTANFYVTNAVVNSAGVYYCVVINSSIGGIWRYASGVWTNITSGLPAGSYAGSASARGTSLIVKPSDPTYLSVTGPNGIGAGYTSFNANTGTPTWAGRTGGQNPTLKAASYDIEYLNYIFGQGLGAFTFGPAICIDPSTGNCFWGGNQSVWYFTASSISTIPIGPPNYATDINTFSWSIGRGQEATVSQDIVCSPGATYPVIACQDLGSPFRGTYTTYPKDMLVRNLEYTCENLEYAASDPSFIVARATGQAGSFADVSSYSPDYGADGSWIQIANTPNSLWQAQITASISNGSGGAGTILDVTAVASGIIFPNAVISINSGGSSTTYGRVQPYGTGGSTGTGGTGTYILSTSSNVASSTLYSLIFIQGGQTVAVDHDHWVTVPAGLQVNPIPAYTTDATGAATWALCSGLPAANWMGRPWTFGKTSKPFAVGYGADLGVVWACLFEQGNTTARLYRSTDSGATFSQIASWTTASSFDSGAAYCLSVPGKPNELWITAPYSGGGGATTGIWHVTNANTPVATVTMVNLPAAAPSPTALTLGAPDIPGGYPNIYYLGGTGFATTQRLYKGVYPGSGATVTWSLYGPTGLQQDLPPSCQLCGIQAIRGDWNVAGRIYVSSNQSGFAYYNP